MRFSCDYNTLLNNLTDISNVVEDALANEDDKNAIFQFKKDGDNVSVKLIGISPVITFRRELEPSSYNLTLEDTDVDVNGIMYMQLKSKELFGFLNSYKSIRKTKVDEVIFEPERGKIKCTVIESANLTQQEIEALEESLIYNPEMRDPRTETYASHWVFDNIAIKPVKLPLINMEVPTETVSVESAKLLLYTSSLMPLLENSTSLFSYIQFDSKCVVAFNKAYATIMRNVIDGDIFDGLRLSYRAINFVEKILCISEELQIAKTDRHIYFRTDTSEAFIIYDTKLAPYQGQLALFNKNSYVRIDRIYFKDVLKRLSLMSDSVEVDIRATDGTVTVKNSKFSQDVPITGCVGMDDSVSVKFKIMPDILNKSIIGADEKFVSEDNPDSADIFVCLCKDQVNPRNNFVAFTDSTGGWFSLVNVKVY